MRDIKMKLNKVALTNFKAFESKQDIEIAPKDINFSSGNVDDRNVNLALSYLKEIIQVGDCNPYHFSEQDLSNNVQITVEYIKKVNEGKRYCYSEAPFPDDMFGFELNYTNTETSKVELSFEIEWDPEVKKPFVKHYKVKMNGEIIGEVNASHKSKQVGELTLNFLHPILLPAWHEHWIESVVMSFGEALHSHFFEKIKEVVDRDTAQLMDMDIDERHSPNGLCSELEQQLNVDFIQTSSGALLKPNTEIRQLRNIPDSRLFSYSITELPELHTHATEMLSEVLVAPLDDLILLLESTINAGSNNGIANSGESCQLQILNDTLLPLH